MDGRDEGFDTEIDHCHASKRCFVGFALCFVGANRLGIGGHVDLHPLILTIRMSVDSRPILPRDTILCRYHTTPPHRILVFVCMHPVGVAVIISIYSWTSR